MATKPSGKSHFQTGNFDPGYISKATKLMNLKFGIMVPEVFPMI